MKHVFWVLIFVCVPIMGMDQAAAPQVYYMGEDADDIRDGKHDGGLFVPSDLAPQSNPTPVQAPASSGGSSNHAFFSTLIS